MTDERKKINAAFLVLHMKTKPFISKEGLSLMVTINPFSISLVQNCFQQIPDQILIITIKVLSQYHSLSITSNFLNHLNETKLEAYLLWIWQSYSRWNPVANWATLWESVCLFMYSYISHYLITKLHQSCNSNS